MNAADATSTRPYLIRALYEWCMDNGFTPYLESVMVDMNASPREARMNQCAAQLCSTRYGNAECKTK